MKVFVFRTDSCDLQIAKTFFFNTTICFGSKNLIVSGGFNTLY